MPESKDYPRRPKSGLRVQFGTLQKLIREARPLPLCARSRPASYSTKVTGFSDSRAIGFLGTWPQTWPMHILPGNQPLPRTLSLRGVALFACFLAGSLILSADTPTELRAATIGTCYCHCRESQAHRGCVKMCEMPKYSARQWARTCAKPRLKLPVKKSDVGPRFPHPGRDERAQLPTPATAS